MPKLISLSVLLLIFMSFLPIRYVTEIPKAINIAGIELSKPRIDGVEHSAI